jgi:hypothetical protein
VGAHVSGQAGSGTSPCVGHSALLLLLLLVLLLVVLVVTAMQGLR